MGALTTAERASAEALACIGYCNPFLPERLELEQRALGRKGREARAQRGQHAARSPRKRSESGFRETNARSTISLDLRPEPFLDFELLRDRAQQLADKLRCQFLQSALQPREEELYREVALFLLYGLHFSITNNPQASTSSISSEECACRWPGFLADYKHYLQVPGLRLPNYFDAAHCFSIFHQIDRAFLSIFSCIIGQSMAMSRLRAAIWESIFTHNMRRYVRGVYRSMADMTTLITGPSGTGKELVAQAIGLSRYQRFEPRKQRFVGAEQTPLLSLNLSALAETIIESELFGHRKGAFTGAVEDRMGWLEACPAEGCVFLDEIGELSEAIQVKLLRVMQAREFNRLGETKRRRFEGKFIAATNRDLQSEIEAGRFRGDLYYRMCADLIQTPSLRQQLQESPEDLELLVRFVATRLLSALPDEVDGLAEETIEWIDRHLGSEYAWPGNIRELEQCVRNVLIRKSADSMPAGVKSQPQKNATPTLDSASSTSRVVSPITNSNSQSDHGELQAVMDGSMTLAEVEQWYTYSVYQRLGQYDLTAERLKINWRTVKAKVKQYAKRQRRHAADE